MLDKSIKPNSRDWLTGALDPFHDFQYAPEGLPDQFSGSSVVQFIKKQVTISAPTGLAAGANWDCHIFTAPLMTSQTAKHLYTQPGYIVQNTATGSLGTINVIKAEAGYDLLPNTYPQTFAPPAFNSVCFSPCDGGNAYSQMRLIGGGFEVHNDTAELYRKGSVSVYSQPTDLERDWGLLSLSGTSYAPGAFYKSRMPPININEAVSNPNSLTWHASEGCYVPLQLDVEALKFQQAIATPLLMSYADNSLDYSGYTSAWGAEMDKISKPDNVIAITQFRADAPMRLAGIETVGAYFNGLGAETVLTLTLRFIVEIAPTPANPTLISLASPSSEYDPEALVLYSRAVRELPPGVKVGSNAAGDWWKTVSSAIKAVAPVISKFGPYGVIAGQAALGASYIGDRVQEVRTEKRVVKAPKEKEKKEAKKIGGKSTVGRDAPNKK